MKKIMPIVLWLLSQAAIADGNVSPIKIPDKVKAECAACHMAYQPGFLPKASWEKIMGSLDKHYGVDASLDPQSVKEISQWLTQHAGTYKRVSEVPPNNRITESSWFIGKHRKISDQTWKNPRVKSKSNCMACHAGADKGNYDDDFVRVPQ